MTWIKEKTMKNGQDIFRENTLEYFKSMLCLVIGFRGDVEMLSFLTKETERLERMYLQETYARGPILAIQELAVRFLN